MKLMHALQIIYVVEQPRGSTLFMLPPVREALHLTGVLKDSEAPAQDRTAWFLEWSIYVLSQSFSKFQF